MRTYRRRAGLSQEEMAYLLGCKSAAKVSRYERCRRLPNLETLLAYEVILGIPERELLGGLFEKVQQKVLKRAKKLCLKLETGESNSGTARKLEMLKGICSRCKVEHIKDI
jgi:transcriptional regulator with XRE-family HTH domain